jgi:hypothetical protein
MRAPKGVAAKLATANAILSALKTFAMSPRASVRGWYGGISGSVIDINLLRARDFAAWVIILPSVALDVAAAVLLLTQQKGDGGSQAPELLANTSMAMGLGLGGNWTDGLSRVGNEQEATTGDKVAFSSAVGTA